MSATSSDTWSKVYKADHITGIFDTEWGRPSWSPWIFPDAGCMLCSSLKARNEETIPAVEKPPPCMHQNRPRSFNLRGSYWSQFIGCKNGLHLLTIFKSATPSTQNTVPNSWGSYEVITRPNAQKHRRKLSSFIRTIHQQICPWVQCLITFPILLVIICSPTWKVTCLGSGIALMITSYLLLWTVSSVYQELNYTVIN